MATEQLLRLSQPWQRRFFIASLPLLYLLASGTAQVLAAQVLAAQVLAAQSPAPLTDEQAQAMVKRVLRVELEAAQDATHPMQYRLRKMSPRLSTTKLIVETRDGDVARLIAFNDAPLTPEAEQNEAARLQGLLNDPSLQRHRQEREQGDAERARKVMRALPDAFLYQYAGIVETPGGPSYRLSFLRSRGY
jgi:hypothetical protein